MAGVPLREETCLDAAASDSEYHHLLQRILSLETLKQKNSQQLRTKDEEIDMLRYKLRLTQEEEEEVFASFQDQLDTYTQEREPNDKLIQSLQTESVEVKNKLVTISARCQDIEETVRGDKYFDSDGQTSTCSAPAAHTQLSDALEKNRQWLVYDQQREHYLRGVLDRLSCLEQQLNQANQALSKHNEAHSDERERLSQMQDRCDRQLLEANTELEAVREQLNVAHDDLEKIRWRCEKKQREVEELEEELQAERLRSRRSAQEEKGHGGEREGCLRAQVEDLQHRLDREKRRSAELLLQVNVLQKTVLSHQDDLRKIGILERQIQISSKDLEDEKCDCLHLQTQLNKVLRELRKTRKTTASEQRQREDAGGHQTSGPHRGSPGSTGPPPPGGALLLNQSFLECPGCQAQYPSGQHRELLAHLDRCLD